MALWTPADATSFTDEQWWEAWDAASLSLTGSAVNQWNDKSGNARHAAQSTSAAKPTYGATSFDGAPGITADGGDRLTLSTTVPVVQSASTDADTANVTINPIGSTDFPGVDGSSLGTTLESPHILVAYWDGSAWHLRVNGAQVSTGGWTVAPTNPGVYWHAMDLTTAGNFGFGRWATKDGTSGNTFCLFNRGNDLARGLVGVCAAIGMGSAASLPSTTDIEKLEGYLAWGAGIDSVLPGGHPYKSAAPTTGAYTLGVTGAGFTTTGLATGLLASRRVAVVAAACSTVAVAAVLRFTRRLQVAATTFATTGLSVALARVRALGVATGACVTAAGDIALRTSRRLAVQAAGLATSFADLVLAYSAASIWTPVPPGSGAWTTLETDGETWTAVPMNPEVWT